MVINLNLAGREGFEPSKELLTPYPLSRRAHSTGLCDLPEFSGGGRGIRTPGDLAATTVFKTVAIVHSAIPPDSDGILSIRRGDKYSI